MQAGWPQALQRTAGKTVTRRRPFTVIECAQRSPEWLSARVGKVTGSRAPAIFMKTKAGKPVADRKNLVMQLVLERITGKPQERPVSGYQVRDGIAREPMARFQYECLTGTLLKTCGFVEDNELPIGCSPDAYVGDFDGLVSAKCPIATTHLATLMAAREWDRLLAECGSDSNKLAALSIAKPHLECIPEEYKYQMAHEMYCTGAAFCDYCSFHPDFIPRQQVVVIRVSRADFDFVWYETQLREFLDECDREVEKVLAA